LKHEKGVSIGNFESVFFCLLYARDKIKKDSSARYAGGAPKQKEALSGASVYYTLGVSCQD
jgi:hypothetical protein